MAITNAIEAIIKAKEKLVEVNGVLGVVMFQVESSNLLESYPKNNNKPTWKVVCNFFTNLNGDKKVTREIFLDKETGEVVDLNGYH